MPGIDRARLDDEEGVTLVEMMIAVLLISVGLLALLSTFFVSLRSIENQRAASGATRVASSFLEQARLDGYNTLAVGTTATTATENGLSYAVDQTITEVDVDSANAVAEDTVKEVVVTVSWTTSGSPGARVSRTSIARPGSVVGGPASGPALGDVSVSPTAVTVDDLGDTTEPVTVTVPVTGLDFNDPVTLSWTDDTGPQSLVQYWTAGDEVQFDFATGSLRRNIAPDTTALLTFSAEARSLTKSASLTVQRPSGTAITITSTVISPEPIWVGAMHPNNGCNGNRCENRDAITFTAHVSGFDTALDEDSVRVRIPLEGGGNHELALVRDASNLTKWSTTIAAGQLKIDGPASGTAASTFTFTAIRVADDVQDSVDQPTNVAREP